VKIKEDENINKEGKRTWEIADDGENLQARLARRLVAKEHDMD